MKLINFDFLMDVLSDTLILYNEENEDVRDLLLKSSFKQIVYLLYVIKKMNFPKSIFEPLDKNIYGERWIIDELQRLIHGRQEVKSDGFSVVSLGGVDYAGNVVDSTMLSFQDAWVLDYVMTYDRFYLVVFDSLINRLIPHWFEIDDRFGVPRVLCRRSLENCHPGCSRFFDVCGYRRLDWNGFVPFSFVYVMTQCIEAARLYEKEDMLDTLVRSFGYTISAAMGKQNTELLHVHPTSSLNRVKTSMLETAIDYVFGSDHTLFNYDNYRVLLGIGEQKDVTSFEYLKSVLMKVYSMIDTNVQIWCNDKNREAVDDVVKKFQKFLLNDSDDFTAYLYQKANDIAKLDKMLKYLPHDIENVDQLANRIVDEMKKMEAEAKKNKMPIGFNPKKPLLESSSSLHKRIAIDDALFEFYKENKRTKKINDIIFWKWSIALYYVAEIILDLPKEHPVYTIDFNDM